MSFVRACSVSEVASGTALAVDVDGTDVAVLHDGDDWYAAADECSHAAVPLSEGDDVLVDLEDPLTTTD